LDDKLAKTLLRKVEELLAAHPDADWPRFADAIQRGDSWISEFRSGKRTTNDLRLVVKMARFFTVPVGYLLNEHEARDATTMLLLGAWERLTPNEQEAVLRLSVTLAEPTPEEHP
jgi:hypothetical protein